MSRVIFCPFLNIPSQKVLKKAMLFAKCKLSRQTGGRDNGT